MDDPTEEPQTIYCAKCQKHTRTRNPERNWTKTGSPMLKGECVACGTRKSTFLKTRKRPCTS